MSDPVPNRPDPTIAIAERRSAVLAVTIGAAVTVLKFVAYVLTDSSAIFSDAVESIVNVLASGFALFAIHYAHQPADQSHPYGHGKIEFFSAGLEGAMMLLAAVVMLFRAGQELLGTPTVARLDLGLVLIGLTMLANAALGAMLVRRGRHSGSIALESDGQHLLSDAITSAVVLLTLVAVRFTGIALLDPICAIGVALYVATMGVRLVRRSAAGLMDEQDPDDERQLGALLDAHVGVAATAEPIACSYHKLRHRHSGRYHWVDFHLVVPRSWDITRAHEAASAMEREIERLLGHADATAHVEPCVSATCQRCATATTNSASPALRPGSPPAHEAPAA